MADSAPPSPESTGDSLDEGTRMLALPLSHLAAGRTVFGRYVLQREVGRGGMGVVWACRDAQLDLPVALKFLPEAVVAHEEAMLELARETRTGLLLTHENIVRIHTLEQAPPLAAIVMELVEGQSLAQRKVRSPGACLSAKELTPIVVQLCAALEYAHGKAKVAHRDLKPGNVLVTAEGQLKVTDFGIARSLTDTRVQLTNGTGMTSGTLLYMSPQQIRGKTPKASDDIYSLGAALYELLTGKPPFFRGSIENQVLYELPEPMEQHRAAVGASGPPIPFHWEETILTCLAKEPEMRPASAAEVAARLTGEIVGSRNPMLGSQPPMFVGTRPPIPGTRAPFLGTRPPLPGTRLPMPGTRAPFLGSRNPIAGSRSPVSGSASPMWAQEGVPGMSQVPFGHPATATPPPFPVSYTGSILSIPGLELAMLPISPGCFVMEAGRADASARTTTYVTLSQPYWLGRTPVTQKQWSAIMGANPSTHRGDDLPVDRVSWHDATRFCSTLTEREREEGRLPEGYIYTLPTEAQWEYACRAGGPGNDAGELDAMAWFEANSGYQSHPVAQKQANPWGLHDMHGNVWEWCSDWFGIYAGGHVTDPIGRESGVARVFRGGSWLTSSSACRAGERRGGEPDHSASDLGFRLALSVAR